MSGRVQGVHYRASALAQARRLGLTGYVRNLPDGQVEAVVCGPAGALQAFGAWLHHGPPAARVRAVAQEPASGAGPFEGFAIRD